MRGNEIIKTWFKLKNDIVHPVKNVCDPFLNEVRLESLGRGNPKVKKEWSSAVECFLNLQFVGQWWSQIGLQVFSWVSQALSWLQKSKMIEYINMKFLQANTTVSDGPVVNDVDRGIIIGESVLNMSGPWKQQAANTLNHHVQYNPNVNGLEVSGAGKEGRWEPNFMSSVDYIVSKHRLSKNNDKCSAYFAFKNILTLF